MEALGRGVLVTAAVIGLCILPLCLRLRAAETQKNRIFYEELTGYVESVLAEGALTEREEALFVEMLHGLEEGITLEYALYCPIFYQKEGEEGTRLLSLMADGEIRALLEQEGRVELPPESLFYCTLYRQTDGAGLRFGQRAERISFGGPVV